MPSVGTAATDVTTNVTAKGQVTIPKPVREALGISEGDQVLWHLEGDKVVLARTVNFLELAGSVPVPAGKQGTPSQEVRRQAWNDRAERLG